MAFQQTFPTLRVFRGSDGGSQAGELSACNLQDCKVAILHPMGRFVRLEDSLEKSYIP